MLLWGFFNEFDDLLLSVVLVMKFIVELYALESTRVKFIVAFVEVVLCFWLFVVYLILVV